MEKLHRHPIELEIPLQALWEVLVVAKIETDAIKEMEEKIRG